MRGALGVLAGHPGSYAALRPKNRLLFERWKNRSKQSIGYLGLLLNSCLRHNLQSWQSEQMPWNDLPALLGSLDIMASLFFMWRNKLFPTLIVKSVTSPTLIATAITFTNIDRNDHHFTNSNNHHFVAKNTFKQLHCPLALLNAISHYRSQSTIGLPCPEKCLYIKYPLKLSSSNTSTKQD